MSSESLIEEVGNLVNSSINRVAQAVQDHPNHLSRMIVVVVVVVVFPNIGTLSGMRSTFTESNISSRTIAPELSTSNNLKAQPTSSWNLTTRIVKEKRKNNEL